MEYIVTRDQGYPIDHPTSKQLEVVELDEIAAKDGVDHGYLLKVDPNDRAFTEDMAKTVATFRQKKASAEAVAKQNEPVEATVDPAAAREATEKAESDRKANVARILGVTGPVKAGTVIASRDGVTVTAKVDQAVTRDEDGYVLGQPVDEEAPSKRKTK